MKNSVKRRLSFLLCGALMLCALFSLPLTAEVDGTVWDGTHPAAAQDAAFSGGKGTEEEPYLLSTALDLMQLAANVGSGKSYAGVFFELTADIDAAGIEGWKPIGGNSAENKAVNPFSGNFNGNFHVVKNVNIKNGWYIGFFGHTKNATIRNFGVASGSVFSKNSVVGGLIGAADNTDVDNCFNKASVSCERSGGTMRVGGLIGITSNNTKITNCYNTGNVVGKTSSTKQWTGGLVGYMGGGLAFEASNCYNSGTVTAMGMASAGGIAGSMDGNAYAEKCFNLGAVSAEGKGETDVFVGTLVGNVLKTTNAMIDSGAVAQEGLDFFGVLHADHLEANYSAVAITLTKIPTMLGSAFLTKGSDYSEAKGATLRAVQETAPAGGLQKLRFVATVDSLNYSAVGFEVVTAVNGVKGEAVEYKSETVYSHVYVKANGAYTELCSAAQLGGSHLFTGTITEAKATGTVEYTVTPFTVNLKGERTTAPTYVITYTDGVFVSAVRAA
ncbi:MAG: hypothetical protein E7620_03580 [Ruminococcaceae bacterium]|nr:hypothetical protein [Oscillospiraceae bacterium]